MRVRFPLGAKILAWFLLNLVLLAVVALIFAQQKLRFGLDSLVAGPAGDRVNALAVLVLQEFNQTPRTEWNATLEKFGREYGVELLLFSAHGPQLGGRPTILPPPVLQRLQESAGPERRDRPPPPPRLDGPPPPNEQSAPPPGRPDVVGLQRAGVPPRYWVLLHAPLPQLAAEGPAMLLIESDSLGAGGLIFDYHPLLWSALAVVAISLLFWLPLVRGITRSLASMRTATARIAEGNFDIALDHNRHDELGALALSIKSMGERLSGLLHGQRRFLGDVAHELCAPLSRLQVSLGILEERGQNADELRDVRDEVDQISALVNELLSFPRASLGAKKVHRRSIELRPLLEEAIRREVDGSAPVDLECEPDLMASTDPDLLLRAVANLLRNAVRYAAHAGGISVRATSEIAIEISDHGPGIPADLIAQIFDPFFRVDSSRTRETGGVGLGLTIAKTCVEACGGSIGMENLSPNGLRVLIRLQNAAHVKS